MKNLLRTLRTEDWVVVLVGTLLLAGAALCPALLPRIPATLATANAWIQAGGLYLIVLAIVCIGWIALGRSRRGIVVSLIAVFLLALAAQVIASIPSVKFYGFESVFFSVILGLLVRNLFRIPEWMKPAIQSEYYIKIGVVCLGATILFNDVLKSGIFGLVQ